MKSHPSLRITMLATALVTCNAAFAQHHHPEPTHGGRVAEADEHHIELLIAGDELRFYLLDSLGKEVPSTGIIGTAYLQFADRTTANMEIRPKKDGTLHTILKNPSAFSVVASLMVDGKFVSARFESGPRASMPVIQQQHGDGDGHQH